MICVEPRVDNACYFHLVCKVKFSPKARSTERVHASAKARLTGVAIRIQTNRETNIDDYITSLSEVKSLISQLNTQQNTMQKRIQT